MERIEFAGSRSSGFAMTRNSAMPTKQHVLGLIDSRREICRPSLIGMQFLYQRTVRATDLFSGSPGLKAKDLIGLLFAHLAGVSGPRAGTRIRLRRFAPARFSAVQIGRE